MVGNLGLSTDAAGRTGMPGFMGELSDLLGCCLQGLKRAPRLLQTDFARAQREGERLTLTLPRRDYFLREAATEGETRTFGTRTQLPQGTGAPSARREPPTRRGKALVALQLQIQQRSIAVMRRRPEIAGREWQTQISRLTGSFRASGMRACEGPGRPGRWPC